jgi:hypothetical protein
MQVPFHRAPVGEEEVRAVSEVIRLGWLTMGPAWIRATSLAIFLCATQRQARNDDRIHSPGIPGGAVTG